MQDAAIAAKIDVQVHKVGDLDRRLGQIDTMIEEAAKRGRTKTAIEAMEGQRRARAALVEERNREASTKRNAPRWLPAGARSRRRPRRSSMLPPSSA
jgi:hypothetical protein